MHVLPFFVHCSSIAHQVMAGRRRIWAGPIPHGSSFLASTPSPFFTTFPARPATLATPRAIPPHSHTGCTFSPILQTVVIMPVHATCLLLRTRQAGICALTFTLCFTHPHTTCHSPAPWPFVACTSPFPLPHAHTHSNCHLQKVSQPLWATHHAHFLLAFCLLPTSGSDFSTPVPTSLYQSAYRTCPVEHFTLPYGLRRQAGGAAGEAVRRTHGLNGGQGGFSLVHQHRLVVPLEDPAALRAGTSAPNTTAWRTLADTHTPPGDTAPPTIHATHLVPFLHIGLQQFLPVPSFLFNPILFFTPPHAREQFAISADTTAQASTVAYSHWHTLLPCCCACPSCTPHTAYLLPAGSVSSWRTRYIARADVCHAYAGGNHHRRGQQQHTSLPGLNTFHRTRQEHLPNRTPFARTRVARTQHTTSLTGGSRTGAGAFLRPYGLCAQATMVYAARILPSLPEPSSPSAGPRRTHRCATTTSHL